MTIPIVTSLAVLLFLQVQLSRNDKIIGTECRVFPIFIDSFCGGSSPVMLNAIFNVLFDNK
jgi:hypothetical protein